MIVENNSVSGPDSRVNHRISVEYEFLWDLCTITVKIHPVLNRCAFSFEQSYWQSFIRDGTVTT